MAQLNSIIGSILRDIIAAQHEANLYSLSLSESYGKDGKAKDFQLPGVTISEMEMDLKYAVVNASDEEEQQNISYSRFRKFLNELCREAATTAITSVSSTILTDQTRDEQDKHFFKRLKKEDELYRQFHSFIFRNLKNAFNWNLYQAIDGQTGKVNTDAVLKKMMEIVRKKFINDTDLDALFGGTERKELKKQAEENVSAALDGLIQKKSEDANFKRSKKFPKLDVAVTAEELEKMPEDTIHSFKLKFSPTACTVTEPEMEDDLEDFVME